MNLHEALDVYRGTSEFPMGAKTRPDKARRRDSLVHNLRNVLRRNRWQYHLLVGLLLVLFFVCLVVSLLPQDAAVRLGALGGTGVSAAWCIWRLLMLSRERETLELLIEVGRYDERRLDVLVEVLLHRYRGNLENASTPSGASEEDGGSSDKTEEREDT